MSGGPFVVVYRETGLGGYELHAAGCAHMKLSKFSFPFSPEGSTLEDAIRDAEGNDGIYIEKVAPCARRIGQ